MAKQYALSPQGGNWGEWSDRSDTIDGIAELLLEAIENVRAGLDYEGVEKFYVFPMVDDDGFWRIDLDSDPIDVMYVNPVEDADIITVHCAAVEKLLKARAREAKREAAREARWAAAFG